MSSLGYDENGELRRTTWFDWRATDEGASLGAGHGEDGFGGFVSVGDTTMVLGSRYVNGNVVESKVWTVADSSSEPGFPLPYVNEMAAGNTLDRLDDIEGDIGVGNESATNGGVLWRMVVPWHGNGTVTREWLIDEAGYLREWTWETSPGLILGLDSRVEVRFDPLTDPDPIVLPQESTEMDLASLGFPDDLPTP